MPEYARVDILISMDFETKRMLGNFPQAYSHLALIETAITISNEEITDEEKIKDNIQ